MAVEKAPYLNYSEVTTYQETIDNGSEIPLLIVKTNNNVPVSDISVDKVLKFISYNNFKKYFSISDNEKEYKKLDDSIKELDGYVKDFYVENSMYGENDDFGLNVPYIYIIDIGKNPTVGHYVKALAVSEMKRKSTAIAFPNTEDVELMKAVDTKLKEETKSGLLRIGYFGVSGQGQLAKRFAKGDVIRPKFDHHGFKDIVTGELKTVEEVENFYNEDDEIIAKDVNYIYNDTETEKYYKYENNSFVEVTLESLEGYSEVVEGYKDANKFYQDSSKTIEITPLDETKIYLNKVNGSKTEAYSYNGTALIPIEVQLREKAILYETDADYKFIIPSSKKEMGGSSETFEEYCDRLSFISQEVQSSRIGIVDKTEFGKIIARICSTPYYVEPGYLPFMSVQTGVFTERSTEERDNLFNTGLIFGEDDYTLSTVTPRICLATSTAWGVEDHDMRTTDALIHARRNVDYHVRRMWKIIAPQLKRNETSVTLRYLQNQIDLYLDSELTKGTIMAYNVKVIESSYNPYKLLVKGKIVPVNTSLAIEFENVIGSPYAIASDYV